MEKKHNRHKSFKFSLLLFYTEGNQTRFVESSDSDIRKLLAIAVPDKKVQKRQQNVYARFNCDMKINEKVIKQINPFLASYYVG